MLKSYSTRIIINPSIRSMIIVDLMARFKRYRYKIIVALLVIIILFYLFSQKGKFKNTFSFTSDPNMVTNTYHLLIKLIILLYQLVKLKIYIANLTM